MNITLLAYGSQGDVQPYVALALALKARGHCPRLAAPENFKDFVEGFNLDYVPLAGDTKALLENKQAMHMIWKGRNYGFFSAMRRIMKPWSELYADSILRAVQGADVVLSSPMTEFIAQSAAEVVGAKCVLSFLAPQLPSSRFASFAFPFSTLYFPFLNQASHAAMEFGWWQLSREEIQATRRRWGLKPWTSSPAAAFRKRNGLSLLGFSSELFARPADWPATHVVTGAWSLSEEDRQNQKGDHQDPGFIQWLEDGPPPIYFGFGSMPVPNHEAFLEMAAELCEDLSLRALVGAGWTDITLSACDLPDNLAIVERADHAWLFPQCAAIVHHGGSGTTHAGLSSGVPNVVCSFFADQSFWGKQVARLGVGSHLRFKNMNGDSLKRALLDALEEGTQQRAADLGSRLRMEQGTLRACEALENRLLSPG